MPVKVRAGMSVAPRGGSKSAGFGCGSIYRWGARTMEGVVVPVAVTVFCLFAAFVLGSGVALELESDASAPTLDSRFFRDSFFDLAARSRARGASSFKDLRISGFKGEDTAG